MRARLEAQAAGKKNKKGFMTPERKKKLRVIITIEEEKACEKFTIFFPQLLLRKKAAEELKKEQERKAAERRKVGFMQIFVFSSKIFLAYLYLDSIKLDFSRILCLHSVFDSYLTLPFGLFFVTP